MTTLCKQNWNIGIIYYDVILPTITILAAISIIPITYSYLKAYISGNLTTSTSPKLLFYPALIFFIIVFIAYITFTISLFTYCHNLQLRNLFRNITSQLYSLQLTILLGILFLRLYYVFDKSTLRLSKSTLWVFVIFYCFTWITNIVAAFVHSNYASVISSIIILLSYGSYITLISFLVALFLYKLVQVYKGSKKNARKFIHLITKTSILCFISTFNVILTAIFIFLSTKINSIHFKLIVNIIAAVAIHGNVWTVLLSYNYFEEWYLKMCGCCDSKCHTLWTKCAGNMEPNYRLTMKSISSKSGDTDGDSKPDVNAKTDQV